MSSMITQLKGDLYASSNIWNNLRQQMHKYATRNRHKQFQKHKLLQCLLFLLLCSQAMLVWSQVDLQHKIWHPPKGRYWSPQLFIKSTVPHPHSSSSCPQSLIPTALHHVHSPLSPQLFITSTVPRPHSSSSRPQSQCSGPGLDSQDTKAGAGLQ